MQADTAMKMTFEPVVAPGTFDDLGALEYRLSHDYEGEWMQDDQMDASMYDAVVRVETRSQQPSLPAVHPPIPTFEGNDQWLEILLRACAPQAAKGLPDGGAAIIGKIAAAARAAGIGNPIDNMRVSIAKRKEQELEAVAAAEAAQDRKRMAAAARRVARRNEIVAAARAAGKILTPLPRPKLEAAASAPASSAALPQPASAARSAAGRFGDAMPATTAVSFAAASALHNTAAPSPAALAAAAAEAAAHPVANAAAQPGVRTAQQDALQAAGGQLPLSNKPAAHPAAKPAAGGGSKGGSKSDGGRSGGGSKRPAETAAGTSAAGTSDAAAATGQVAAAADASGTAGPSTRAAKRQRQQDAPRRSWTLQLSFSDDVTGKPIHFKADGKRFTGAKAPASLKFAFNRWYRVRLTADSSLNIRENAHLMSRSPVYFEHPTDQAAATPFCQDDAVKFIKVAPEAAASSTAEALHAGASSGPASAAASMGADIPPSKKAKGAANGAVPAAPAVSTAQEATPAAPPQEASPSRTAWEGRWRNLAEPTKKTQRAAAWLGLRCEGLGPLELPLMAKIYEYTTLHADLQDRAALQGQVLKHITFTVERNPFSELLEVAGAMYTAVPPAKKA